MASNSIWLLLKCEVTSLGTAAHVRASSSFLFSEQCHLAIHLMYNPTYLCGTLHCAIADCAPIVFSQLQIVCPKGHYCKTGSTKPTKCPPLMTCPERSEVPSDNYAGMVLDLLMFLVLWIVWMLYRW